MNARLYNTQIGFTKWEIKQCRVNNPFEKSTDLLLFSQIKILFCPLNISAFLTLYLKEMHNQIKIQAVLEPETWLGSLRKGNSQKVLPDL